MAFTPCWYQKEAHDAVIVWWRHATDPCVVEAATGSVSYAQIVKKHLPDLDLDEYRGEPSVSWRLT